MSIIVAVDNADKPPWTPLRFFDLPREPQDLVLEASTRCITIREYLSFRVACSEGLQIYTRV